MYRYFRLHPNFPYINILDNPVNDHYVAKNSNTSHEIRSEKKIS